MKHEVVNVDTKEVYKVFEEGQAAAEWFKKNKYYYPKCRIVPRRETALEKFNDPKFLCVPNMGFINARIREDTPDKVFLADEKEIKEAPFAEWLNKQKPHYLETITAECETIWYGVKIEFAKTAEEIIWVYLNGPASCTCTNAKGRGLNAKNPHPLTVIGDSDIQVAYVTTKSGKSVAFRVLVCPEKKIFDYGYTNRGQIIGEKAPDKLRALGYEQGKATEWAGCKIKRIPLVEDETRFLIPALDVIYNLHYYVSDFGDHLRLGIAAGKRIYYCKCARGYAEKK